MKKITFFSITLIALLTLFGCGQGQGYDKGYTQGYQKLKLSSGDHYVTGIVRSYPDVCPYSVNDYRLLELPPCPGSILPPITNDQLDTLCQNNHDQTLVYWAKWNFGSSNNFRSEESVFGKGYKNGYLHGLKQYVADQMLACRTDYPSWYQQEKENNDH